MMADQYIIDTRPQRWGFWMTCLWLAVYVLTTQLILTLIVLAGYALWTGQPININTARALMQNIDLLIRTSMVVNLLSFPLIVLMVKSKRGSSWRDYMAWYPVGFWRVILWCIICVVTVVLTGLVHRAMGWGESGFMKQLTLTSSPIWLVLSVVVVAPIFEEMVFRGFAYGGFERSLGAWPAVFLSSIMFTVLHMQYNVPELLQIFILGMVLALARMRTKSLITPIAMHAVNNGLATFAVFAAANAPK